MGFVAVATVSMLLSGCLLPGVSGCPPSPNLIIVAPQKLEALNGSCLMIPCNFSTIPGDATFDSSKPVTGIWRKNDAFDPGPVVYSSSSTSNMYHMNITGNLSQKQCTSLMFDLSTTYTDSYYFRIENDLFKATACNSPVMITVNDSPPQPRINVPGDLRENTSVAITCSASTPCPLSAPKLTWTLQPQPHHHTEENADGTFTTKVQQTISLSDQHDGLNISCSASYAVTGGNRAAGTVVTLSVSYAPKDTSASISPSGSVSAGSRVNLTCSSRAKPPVSSFTWFRISTDGPANVSVGALYTFNATGGAVYYCEASNALGAQTSSQVHLTVGSAGNVLQWEPVVGGILGIIVLVGLILGVWCFLSTHQVAQTQRQTDEVPVVQEEEVENIHYGEITFIEVRADAASDSVQKHQQQQDSVYAQVTVSSGTSSSADVIYSS